MDNAYKGNRFEGFILINEKRYWKGLFYLI